MGEKNNNGYRVLYIVRLVEHLRTMTFFARFSDYGAKKFIFKKSDFEKINSQWFYVEGITPNINLNRNYPCGSRKKFKKCCSDEYGIS